MDTQIIYFFLLLFFAFVLSIAVIPQILKVVKGKKIFDAPGGRKIHKNSTPSMGGVAVFISFIFISMLTIHESDQFMAQYYYFSLILLFFTGLRDDLLPVKSVYKFYIQIVAAAIIAGFANIRLTSLYSLSFLYDQAFPEWLSFFLTLFAIVGLTNAYNLIDGIDGLAGSVASVLLTTLCIWFGINEFWVYAFLCGIMLGAILGFLCYNWSPAKIFMGDTGSLVIGFFCSSMLIVFMNLNEISRFRIENSMTFFVCVFIYPFVDIFRVFFMRLKRKRSPFSPDKLHVHLLLKRIGFEHHQITLLITFLSILLLVLFIMLNAINTNELAIILFVICYCFVGNFVLRKKVEKFKKKKKPIELNQFLKSIKTNK